jgi:uncharacterized protein
MFINYTVIDLRNETADTVSIYLSPSDNSGLEPYLPGQFITVQLGDLRRNYTLSDAPGKNFYRITVKREEQGKMSSLLHKIKIGEKILALKKPTGGFHLSPESNKAVVLLSAGVGITPMISILNHFKKHQDRRPIWFIHSARTENDLIMREDLLNVKQELPNLNLFFHFTRAKNFQSSDGPTTQRMSIDFVRQILPDSEFDYFLCGPTSFINSFYHALLEQGIPQSNVHYELFSTARFTTEEKVKPRTDYVVFFTRSGKQIVWQDRFKSLLELAEAEGIPIDFSCRSGSCLTCETRLVKGDVKYTSELFLEPRPDHILPCSAIPLSDLIIQI